MPFQNFISVVYNRICCIISSVYDWFCKESENHPVLDVQNNNQGEEREENDPPEPPPLPALQLIAAMQLPLLHHHQNLREVLEPLAEVLAAHPTAQQPQLRLGKRWRIENHTENLHAIEKALEEFEKDETPIISDEARKVSSEEIVVESLDELQRVHSSP